MKPILLLTIISLACTLHAQVLSYTMGIDVNCPSGLGEWWVPVREGLARLEGVESISETCDRRAGTGELRLRRGRLVDPITLGQQIRDIRVGARLRALEATIDGTFELVDGKPHLRIPGAKQPLVLAALTQKVQMDAINKKPLPLSAKEKEAFRALAAKWNGKATPVRITGPLRKPENSTGLILEVRQFSLNPRT